MATIRDLLVKVGFNVEDAALKRADVKVKNLKQNVIKAAAAITAMAGAIGGLAYTTARYAVELGRTADMLGFTTQELQGLRAAADIMEVSSGTLTRAMRHLGRMTGAAMQGSKMAVEAFADVGVTSFKRADGAAKTQIEILEELADHIHALRTPQEQLAVAFRVFGRAGTDMLPMLKGGAAAIRHYRREFELLGYAFTEDDVKLSQEFKEQVTLLKFSFRGLRHELGIKLIPQMAKFTRKILDFIRRNRELIAQGLDTFFKVLSGILKIVYWVMRDVYGIVHRLVSVFGGWKTVLKVLIPLVTALISIKIIRGFMSLATAVGALATGLQGLAFAQIAVSGLAGLFAIIGIAIWLLLDDYKAFLAGHDSLIGRLEKSHPVIANILITTAKLIRSIGDALGYITKMVFAPLIALERLISLFRKTKREAAGLTFPELPATNGTLMERALARQQAALAAPAAARTRDVNIHSAPTVNLTVPEGTNEFQRSYLRDMAHKYFGEAMEDHLREVTLNNPKLWEGT